MNAQPQERGDYGFVLGLLTGTVIGASLAMWFAPRLTAELRERVTDSARTLRRQASARYEQASARVGDAVEDLTRKGQDVRDEVAGAVAGGAHEVARGAHEVERYATAARSDRASEGRSAKRGGD